MLPAVRRAYRRPGALSAGWYAGPVRAGWSVDELGMATINLPLRGSYLREVGRVRRVVDPSRLVWFAPNEASRSCPTPKQPGEPRHAGLYLQASDALVAAMVEGVSAVPASTDAPAGPEVVRAAWDALEQAEGLAPADAEDRVVELFLALLAPLGPPEAAGRRVRDAQVWLAEDPVGAPGPTELAAALGLSRFSLCRQFRAATGRSVLEYREDLRLVRAVERLRAGERDLAALAHELGFSSHSHFTLRFRRRVGCAPSACRS